jgi:hypothetical protein
MLEVFREIERKGEKLIFTDNGKPVLLTEPIRACYLRIVTVTDSTSRPALSVC